MSAKDVVFKSANRAINDSKYTGMGVHDGIARIHHGHIQWMLDRIIELEQQLQQAHAELASYKTEVERLKSIDDNRNLGQW